MGFTIDLPTKPYVKHFIVSNFGDPADFSKDPFVNSRFRRCLSKPSVRTDSIYEDLSFERYSVTTKVLITEDDFYRYGWEITKSDVVSFGKVIEPKVKFLMRTMVAYYSSIMKDRDAILKFQSDFGYDEDTWSYESIRKDYQRYGPPDKISFSGALAETFEKYLLKNLFRLGTISQDQIKFYERLTA